MKMGVGVIVTVSLLTIAGGCRPNIERRVRDIVNSRISAEEKGLRLAKVLTPGTSQRTVQQALGMPDIASMESYGGPLPREYVWIYPDYRLRVAFDKSRHVVSATLLQSDEGPATRPVAKPGY